MNYKAQLLAGAAGSGQAALFNRASVYAAASATNPSGMFGWGWAAASVGSVVASGGGADFGSLADIDPSYVRGQVSGNPIRINEPYFGGYADKLVATRILGAEPTRLVVEFVGRFSEQGGYIGLGNNGTEVAAVAYLAGGPGFFYQAGSTANVPNGDTNWHHWKFEIDDAQTLAYMDGDLQATLNTEADRWPTYFENNDDNSPVTPPGLAWFDVRWEL